MTLRFCANLNFLFTEGNANLLEKFKLAQKAGFKAVEIGYPSEDVLPKVVAVKEETGIETVLINICLKGPQELQFGSTSIPGVEQQFQSNLHETVELAKQLKCKKIHLMAGKRTEKSFEDHLETYVKNLKYAAKYLEKESIIGLIEPINKYALPGYFLNNYETAVDVLNQVNSPNIKLMVDIFHLQHINGNVTNIFKELQSHIGHVQVAQVPHRHEPNVPGELDFKYVFQAIKDSGYNGWIGCEYKPKNTTVEGLNWVADHGSF